MKRLSLICLVALLTLLTSCSAMAQTPPNQVIQLALSQTLTNTQTRLAQELGLGNELGVKPNFRIDQIKVKSREKLASEVFQNRAPGDVYKVQGTFNTTLTMSTSSKHKSSFQHSAPFEIYLGNDPQNSDSDVDTWFLIKPIS